MKKVDFDQMKPKALVDACLGDGEPRLVVTHGQECAVVVAYRQEMEALIDAHPRRLSASLRDAREDVSIGMAALQTKTTGEQDAMVFLDGDAPALVVVGIERFARFAGGGAGALPADAVESLARVLDDHVRQVRTREFLLDCDRPVVDVEAAIDLLSGLLLVELTTIRGDVTGREHWEAVTRFHVQQSDFAGDTDGEIRRCYEVAHGFLQGWQIEACESTDAALTYLLRQTARAAHGLNKKNTEDLKSTLAELAKQMRPDAEAFMTFVRETAS